MSVEFHRESPRKFDSRTLNRQTLNRWTGRTACDVSVWLPGNFERRLDANQAHFV